MTPLDPILRELGEEHRTQTAPASVERALAAEFRKRHRRSWMPWVGFVAAGAASMALAFYWVQPPPAETIALRVASPKAPEVKFTPKPVSQPAPRVAVMAKVQPPVAPQKSAAREIATDFFPLRAGPVLEPGEIARVVRTRVPRRELARFGLVGSNFYLSGASMRDIGADVVFGYDGTARAIRFVHDSQ